MTRTIFIAATLVIAVTLPITPAQAQVSRTFVSAAGNDGNSSNNCANVATPCRHLATAYAATAPNGEIYVLDPANYGSLTITGPVSIEGHGWASIAPVAGLPAIKINANPADKINIIGVVLDGTALANTTGIVFNSGGSLNVRDSVIRNFGGGGITFAQNASTPCQLYVSNTLVSDIGHNAIFIDPSGPGTTTVALDRVHIENNGAAGLVVETSSQAIDVTVSDSVSMNNAGDGIVAQSNGTLVNVMVRNSTIANSGNTGLEAIGPGANVRVTRSTISRNNIAWANSDGGDVLSFGDNDIFANGSANNAPTSIGHE